MQIASCSVRCLSASDSDRTLDSPLRTADTTASRAPLDHEMAFNFCDAIRCALRRGGRRGIARHKDQKSFRAIAHTDSQTPKEETDTNSVARDFAETKESFSESITNRDAQEQIKAQKNISYSNTERIAVGDRDSVCESGGTNRCCSRKKGLAERVTFA